MQWISVKDRMPEHNGKYLTFSNQGGMDATDFALNLYKVDQYDFEDKKRAGWYELDNEYGYFEIHDVTHWMPLPEPPKEEA